MRNREKKAVKNTIILTTAVVLGLSAVSGSRAESMDPKLHAMLPPDIQASGEVRVGTEPTAPPYVFYGEDNKTLVGLEVELAHALGERLGVKFTFLPTQFASIVPGIEAGRFDLGLSAMGDFVPREKVVDEVDYSYEATGIIVAEGNPHHIMKLSDACGLRAAGVQGSIPLQLLDKQKGLCPADKPLEVLQFPSNDQLTVALHSGRVDLSMDTYGVAAYTLAHQPGTLPHKLELVKGARYAIGYQAIVVSKKSPQLRDAIKAALESMMSDGSYKALFAKWELADNALPKITVNDAARYADYMKLD
jgi:polar amino acid transport system substrate-binding protein